MHTSLYIYREKMWVAIISGFLLYGLFKFFFYGDNVLDVGTYDSSALFSIANRLEKHFWGKTYVGLRIPDADTGSRQNIVIVHITGSDGTWVTTGVNSHKIGRHPNPVPEIKQQISVLEFYLEQRGCHLPEGYVSYKIVCPNPKFCWVKGAFRGAKNEKQESFHQQLNFILSTALTWDRLELKANKFMLGELLEFKGKDKDIQLLRNIRRSKVGRLEIQQTSMFTLAHSKLQVLYSPRDYRTGGASAFEWNEANVRSNTEVMFQLHNSSKIHKVKLSSIISMTLSA